MSKALLDAAGRTAPGVFWRIFLGGACGLVCSSAVFLLWYRLIFKKGWLSIHKRADKVLAYLFVPLTALSILTFTVLSGLTMGIAHAIAYLVVHEHLGEQAGRLAFKGITTAVIVARKSSQGKPMNRDERLAYANRLINGEESIAIESLKTITPHHLAELSTMKVESYIPGAENKAVHAAAVKITEHSLSWMIYAAADDRTDFLYKTVVALVESDRRSDGDGRVTVEEIAVVLSRVHMEKAVVKFILEAGMIKSGLFLLLLIPVLAVPPFLAFLVRSLIMYIELCMTRRSDYKAPPSTLKSDKRDE